jgi:hypothetical protein
MVRGDELPDRCKVKCRCRRRPAPPAAKCFSGICAAVHAGAIRGDVKRKVFHTPGCKRFLCPSCTRVFPSAEAAVKAGFRPHPACAPKKPAQPKPPRRPHSKQRGCKTTADCVLLPVHSPCSCPPCGKVWPRAVNRKALKAWNSKWAARRCKAPVCAACVPQVLGHGAVCTRGQCTVQP